MLVAFSIFVALLCVLASARRLVFVTRSTALHPDELVKALGRRPTPSDVDSLRQRLEGVLGADWERDVLDAVRHEDEDARAALVNEQLTELDFRTDRWSAVPRVAASVATSVGILLGTIVLRRGLTAAPELTLGAGDRFVHEVLYDAISVAAFGLAGTAFCLAVHVHARRLTRARREALDRFIEKLESASSYVQA